ncbi:MAG TPA: cation-translocating P-type ATPase [Candidatus Anaerotignum merdipullorum]|nr:cation-translocating P-type ATPase [Candidatus Anaerotignum merdipullorum]
MEKIEAWLEWGGVKKDIALLVIGGLSLLCSLLKIQPFPFHMAWIAVAVCGIPILLEAVIGLVTAFDIKADVLVSIALIASLLIGEYFAAGEVAFIMQLGALLEDMTVSKARAGIEKLVHLTPRTARRISENQEEIISAEAVQVGDLLRVLPGETIPVDGIIRDGQTSVNQAVMTGESLPVDKGVGDEVASGTVNQFGSFDMEATKVGEDSSIQRMIRLVQSADAGKAKIVGIADRWATWIVVIALLSAALTWWISGEIIRAVTILVVFCPCALVLATPTAIMAAIGNVTKHGILVREGDALERLAGVSKISFDKTGTLTYGAPQVRAVCPAETERDVRRFICSIAAVEARSEHPLGKAIVRCCQERESGDMPSVSAFRMIPGRGVSGEVKGVWILAGNAQLLEEAGVPIPEQAKAEMQRYVQEGCTLILAAEDNRYAGFFALADTLREDAVQTIEAVKRAGVTPVLLTGDHENAARHIADGLGIAEVHAECLPEDKLRWIAENQTTHTQVCMIGDGINDAPALKKAYVGIAMGGIGSDIAIDAADIVLVQDDIREIPHLLRLSKRMMLTIRCNLTFSMMLNFVAILLAMTGVLHPVLGALVHNAGSVVVILHSAWLLHWKNKK